MAQVNEVCQAIRERLENENIGYIPGVERPLLKISNRYQGLWLEHLYDSILYAQMDPEKLYLAENAVCEFIARQRENGQLPLAMTASGVGYSHIQECVSMGKLCLMIYEMNGDRDFLKTVYGALAKWVAWLRRCRMTTGRGLIEQFVGYDTGHDNSLRNVGMGCQGRNQRSKESPSLDADVLPPDDGVTPILAVDMNCNFYGNHMALSRMADLLGYAEEAESWREQAAHIKKRLFEECFCAEDCFFYDVDRNGNQRKCLCSTIFHLFIEEVLDRETDGALIDEIYRRHISNPREFATPYPFPPIAICDPAWKKLKPENCWGYYTQGNIAIRTTLWMEQYGFGDAFDRVCRGWVEAWTTHFDTVKVGQELDPITGVPTGCSQWYSSGMVFYLYATARLGSDQGKRVFEI